MLLVMRRTLVVAALCVLVTACSATPTGPSPGGSGPALSQGPLVGLIPDGPPPVPERIAGPTPSALGATRFLAFGDSITAGTMSLDAGGVVFLYDVPSHAYSERLRLALDQFHAGNVGAPRTYAVANAGNPGEWAVAGATRIQSAVTASRPQGLLLLEGINDLGNGQSVETTVAALGRIVNTARASNVTVLVATMFQTYESCDSTGCRENAQTLIPRFNDAIRAMAQGRQNVYVVDLYTAFGTDHRFVGADGLHPNDEGYARMASTFLAAIEAVFGIRSSFQ